MTDKKIGTLEAIGFVLTVMINHIILNLPKNILDTTASGAFLNVIFITCIALIFVYIISKLLERFPSLDIFDIANFLGGKWLKNLIGILFLIYFIFTISILIRSFSEGLKIIFFPRATVPIIMLLILLALVFANKLGINPLIRANLFFIPLAIFSILFIFIANIGNMNFERILPILGNGVSTTFFSGISNLFAFGGISFLYLLPPYLKEEEKYKKIALISIALSGVLLLTSVATLLFMFPHIATTEEIFPLYLASRYIEFGRFFQRLDAVFLLIWIISILSYLSIGLYLSTSILKKITNLKYSKWFVALFGIIIFTLGLLPNNLQQISFLESTVYQYIVLILVFVISLILLILANFKKSKKEKFNGTTSL